MINSFDNAMRKARIADFNIIRVTSIVPPETPVILLQEDGAVLKGLGHMLPAVYEAIYSNTPGDIISAGVGIGVPRKSVGDSSGVIFTFSAHEPPDIVRSTLRDMVEEGMDEMRYIKDYEFKSAVASATVERGFVCAFSSAAFCDDHLSAIFDGV
jgi:arginine decarboxylase